MEIKDIMIIILPIIAALLSSYLTYYFSFKSKKKEAILRFKEEKYANLIILLKGFVGITANSELKKKFLDERYKSWLYCSDEVTKAINNMLERVKNNKIINHELGRKLIGKIILEMRKDLLGKTKLKENDFQYIDVIKK